MPVRMSSACRRVAPAYPETLSSGTYVVIGACWSSSPRSTRTPATQPTNDFVTDMSRCVLSGRIPCGYCSLTSRPACMSRNPSVYVSARTSETGVTRPSTR
jgi:hypothetical protein